MVLLLVKNNKLHLTSPVYDEDHKIRFLLRFWERSGFNVLQLHYFFFLDSVND